MVEVFLHEPCAAAHWTLAGGTIHHLALNTATERTSFASASYRRAGVHGYLRHKKTRNYFKSAYVRFARGACFRAGMDCAEGGPGTKTRRCHRSTLVFPPCLKDRRDEWWQGLNLRLFNSRLSMARFSFSWGGTGAADGSLSSCMGATNSSECWMPL